MKLSVFYFSGTGNTKFVAEKICRLLSRSYRAELHDVTEQKDFTADISAADLILIAFPIYGGAPPIPMRDFVKKYSVCFKDKRVAIAETQYFFSGDGAASLGRTIEKYGGTVVAAEHFNMPNNLSDCTTFRIKNGRELKKTLAAAQARAEKFAECILDGRRHRRGFSLPSHAVGYYTQRKFWRKGEAKKRGRLKIDPSRCVKCGACVRGCSVLNLKAEKDGIHPRGNCVFCYRCVNLCPKQAISLIGKAPPVTQYRGPHMD